MTTTSTDHVSATTECTDIPPPKVSVCIPAYQAAAYLPRLLGSVLDQTYADYEVVVIDNHSTDGTPELLAGFDDPRLRVIRNSETLPLVDNWNFGIRQTRGEFVKLICADDLLKPGCIAAQAAVLDTMPEIALVSVKCDFVDDDGRLIVPARGLRRIEGRVTAGQVVKRVAVSGINPIGAPLAGMFRRADFDRVGGFSAQFPFVADLHLWVRLLEHGDFYGVPEAHAAFRVRGGSLSGLTSLRTQLVQSLAFERWLGADPRWQLSRADLVRGEIRCREQTLLRAAMFGVTAWRVNRRSRSSVPVPTPPSATDTPLTLTTVICAYTMRRWDDLLDAVQSALSQDVTGLDVVVVVDHCQELYARARARLGSLDRVTVVKSDGPKGLSGARNTGVRTAGGDVVAFLDDDAAAEPGWARALLRHYHDPRVAAVGGHAAAMWPESARPQWFPSEFDWVVGCSYTGQPTELAQVRNPLGCNMSIRRSVFDEVGEFRSEVGRVGTHPVGGEETEFCLRIAERRPESLVLYDPEAVVRHRVTSDRTTVRYFHRRCYHEGMSKAVVADLAGAVKPLSAERRYTTRTLPRGVLRELVSRRRGGPRRAVLIVWGLAVTTAGYLRAKTHRRQP
ncbi:glycosyltransferase [Mycolicibacterium vaccae]|uniref:glycosyltransferase n=1 Tax=Mycolicibacterium vaccae TaxID=1810 RepID=UPI003CE973FB